MTTGVCSQAIEVAEMGGTIQGELPAGGRAAAALGTSPDATAHAAVRLASSRSPSQGGGAGAARA